MSVTNTWCASFHFNRSLCASVAIATAGTKRKPYIYKCLICYNMYHSRYSSLRNCMAQGTQFQSPYLYILLYYGIVFFCSNWRVVSVLAAWSWSWSINGRFGRNSSKILDECLHAHAVHPVTTIYCTVFGWWWFHSQLIDYSDLIWSDGRREKQVEKEKKMHHFSHK